MSGASSADPPSDLPAWLKPGLISLLADHVVQDIAGGLSPDAVAERVLDAALAFCPALPRPQIREAVAIAMWVGGGSDAR